MICIVDISKAPVNFNLKFLAFEKNKRLVDIALNKQNKNVNDKVVPHFQNERACAPCLLL